jgi:hypothetical protein
VRRLSLLETQRYLRLLNFYLKRVVAYYSQQPAGLDPYFTPFLIPCVVPDAVRNGKEERGG